MVELLESMQMAFPETSSGSDLMSAAPSEVSGKQLKEVSLRLL